MRLPLGDDNHLSNQRSSPGPSPGRRKALLCQEVVLRPSKPPAAAGAAAPSWSTQGAPAGRLVPVSSAIGPLSLTSPTTMTMKTLRCRCASELRAVGAPGQ